MLVLDDRIRHCVPWTTKFVFPSFDRDGNVRIFNVSSQMPLRTEATKLAAVLILVPRKIQRKSRLYSR